jgi:hypothetical protein
MRAGLIQLAPSHSLKSGLSTLSLWSSHLQRLR